MSMFPNEEEILRSENEGLKAEKIYLTEMLAAYKKIVLIAGIDIHSEIYKPVLENGHKTITEKLEVLKREAQLARLGDLMDPSSVNVR